MRNNEDLAGVHHGGLQSKKQLARPSCSSGLLQGLEGQGDQLVPVATFKQDSRPITADPLHKALIAVVNRTTITHPYGAARENHERRQRLVVRLDNQTTNNQF